MNEFIRWGNVAPSLGAITAPPTLPGAGASSLMLPLVFCPFVPTISGARNLRKCCWICGDRMSPGFAVVRLSRIFAANVARAFAICAGSLVSRCFAAPRFTSLRIVTYSLRR